MFGTTNTTSVGGGFGFGQSATTTSTSSTGAFGQSGGFGALNLTQPNPASGGGFSFAQTITPAGGGLSRGQPAAAVAPSSGGFSFASPATSGTTTGGFSFAQPTSTAPSVGFGAIGQTAMSGNLGGSAGFNFGSNIATPSAPPLTMGQAAAVAAAASSAPTLAGLFSVPAASSTGPSGLNFGFPATSTTGLTLGTSLAATSNSTGGFSFLSNANTTLGLGGSVPLTSTPSLGLGGAQPPTAAGSNISGLQSDGKSTKETPLPPEIISTIEQFENYKSSEKAASESNLRQTAAPFHKLGVDTSKLKQHVLQLSNKHAQLQGSTNILKTKVLENVENVKMARRTQETAMAQQGDNKAPEQYFLQLVRSFEDRMRYCRSKIEEVENCQRANNGSSGASAEDIKNVLRREHETLKILAAKVYILHNTLIERCQQLNTPVENRPKSLFKPRTNESPNNERTTAPSSVLRPLLGDGGSGLFNFQAGQQKVKSMSLGAPPPTLPLGSANPPSLLGSYNQNSLFNNNTSLWGTNNNNNNNNKFKFDSGMSSSFGSTPLRNCMSTPLNNTTGIGFGNTSNTTMNQTSLFGTAVAKPFGC